MTETLLTIDEAAARLRKSRRWLREWLSCNRADAAGEPYGYRLGRTWLFRESDLARILRSGVERARRPYRPRRPVARRSASPGSSEAAWALVRELTGDPTLGPD